MSNNLSVIEGDIYGVRETFAAVQVDKSLNFEREAGFALQLLSRNDYTIKVAMGNRQSVTDAITNVAAIGISLNPATKQAYLVPRDGRICLDISYMGLMDLATASGSILWAQAEIVRATDTFALHGFDKPPTHAYSPFSTDRGEIVGVYVVAKTADGEYLTCTMTIAEVHAIRARSTAWKSYLKDKKSCPWVTDEGEMIRKTCVKRASKYWPVRDRLESAIHYLNTQGGEGIDFNDAPTSDPELLKSWIAKAQNAVTTDELTGIWKAGAAALRDAGKVIGNYDDFEAFKAIVAEHGKKLSVPPLEGEAA